MRRSFQPNMQFGFVSSLLVATLAVIISNASYALPGTTLSDEDWASCSGAGGNSVNLPIQSCTVVIDEVQRVLEKLVAAYNNRGVAYRSNGEVDRAIEDYNQAIHLRSDYYIAINNRGVAYMSKGDIDRAISDYDRVVQLKPDYLAAFYNRAIAFTQKGLFEKAIADYDTVIQADPKNAVVLYQRGTTKLKKGDKTGGESDLRLAESIKPGISEGFGKRK